MRDNGIDVRERVVKTAGRHRLLHLGMGVLVVSAVLVGLAEYVARNAEPMLRRRVVANLEERFHSPVELDELHLSVLHGVQVTGGGLRVLNIAGPARPDAHPERGVPMLSIQRFEFRTGVRELFEPTLRVVTVYVQGMRLNIPPRQERGPLFGGSDDPKKSGQPRLGLVVDKIVGTDVTLTIETTKPGKAPLVFAIRTVTLLDLGAKKPLHYEATVMNPKPRGLVHASGDFGPWQQDDPRGTAIDGSYTFVPVDLSTIHGLGGTLSAQGKYQGTLGRIAVGGSADVPDFRLDVSEGPVAMHHDFDATVDGTTGDTYLTAVRANFLSTQLLASGSVVRATDAAGGVTGHDIELTVESGHARIEDLLRLGVKTSPPLMRGAMTLKTRLSIPPGTMSVSKKMRLAGTFAIRGAIFSNPRFQQTVDSLSERAQGHPRLANATEAQVVASRMAGSFSLADQVLHVPGLDYQLPGAKVHVAGDYGLSGQTFEFAGTVRTEATASQMLTGWKSALVRPFDGFLKKNGAGVEVPIKVSGTKSSPKFGVDLDKMGLGFLKGQPGTVGR